MSKTNKTNMYMKILAGNIRINMKDYADVRINQMCK